MKKYDFGEKEEEYYAKGKITLPVWQSPKYLYAKKRVIEMLESKEYKDVLTESDFWILMNVTKTNKMSYTGLIISHNGCLKINDTLEAKMKFKPQCLSLDKDGYKNSLVYSYNCPEQGLYEVGEVSDSNCKNEYPYAMAFKRCFDRVVLKNSKLAYAGVYSDSEADEFQKEDIDNMANKKTPYDFEEEKMIDEQLEIIASLNPELKDQLRKFYKKDPINLTKKEASQAINSLMKKGLIKDKRQIEKEIKESEEVF